MAFFHRCQSCGYVTDLSNSLPAFEENPHCRQCGLSVTESDTKMQDDLTALMARNLHLGAVPPPEDTSLSTPPTPQVLPQPAPITYITQHYHHSAHIAAPAIQQDTQVSTILENAGINASALLPSQVQLFRNAAADQQQRLIELWQIAPPTYGNQLPSGVSGNWPTTNMEQEERAARERWEQQEQARQQIRTAASLDSRPLAEPYMQEGYSNLPNINGITAPTEYRQSTDPVYHNSREWWAVHKTEPMEHQYGMMQHMMQLHGAYGGRSDGDQEML